MEFAKTLDYIKGLENYNNNQLVGKFEELYQSLLKWNKKLNLTRITNENDFIEKHIIDSIFLHNVLVEKIGKCTKLIDIGTGGGFPGIVLAILGWKLILNDKVSKKTVFLEHIRDKFNLNYSVQDCLYKDLVLDNQTKYTIVSRALGSYHELIDYAQKNELISSIFIMSTEDYFLDTMEKESISSDLESLSKHCIFYKVFD
jgi:16S rRNA (guanine527-N7)-methyltransferase